MSSWEGPPAAVLEWGCSPIAMTSQWSTPFDIDGRLRINETEWTTCQRDVYGAATWVQCQEHMAQRSEISDRILDGFANYDQSKRSGSQHVAWPSMVEAITSGLFRYSHFIPTYSPSETIMDGIEQTETPVLTTLGTGTKRKRETESPTLKPKRLITDWSLPSWDYPWPGSSYEGGKMILVG